MQWDVIIFICQMKSVLLNTVATNGERWMKQTSRCHLRVRHCYTLRKELCKIVSIYDYCGGGIIYTKMEKFTTTHYGGMVDKILLRWIN